MTKFSVVRGFNNKELLTLLRESMDLIEKYRGPLPEDMRKRLNDFGRQLSVGLDTTEAKREVWLFIDTVDQFLVENHGRLKEMAARVASIRESARKGETTSSGIPGGQ